MVSGHHCDKCQGTGMDFKKTKLARKQGECDNRAYIRCWMCNGNGLDPAKFFWKTEEKWNSDIKKLA